MALGYDHMLASPQQQPTLLLVDDQPANIRALHQAFAGDYRVLMATSGLQALQLCRSQLPDLVLLDVVMPGMDGHEVCRRLKADPALCAIPVIFVTAQDDAAQEAYGLELGAADFIAKPINLPVVRARARTQLGLARANRELKLLNEALESRIADRTRDIELAMHQAQAASRAKSQFLSNMSHEIRTPINGVIGMAYLALDSDPNPLLRNYLEKIHSCGKHLVGIVNDILDYSKIEAGKMAIEETDLSLLQVFDEVKVLLAGTAEDKGLRLDFECEPALWAPLRGDPQRIRQVLLNYVGNAIKFTSQGWVRVRASTTQRTSHEVTVRFEVEDTGIGLSETQAANLFQSFQQADASTTRQFGGTGLGLAISKQLAGLMGGDTGVNSVPGQGSTFWFTARLSMVDAPARDASKPAAPVAPALASSDLLAGLRILVAEDNLVNQQVAVGLLERVGATVVVACNGREALEIASRESFDCVLMDVQMPVMDGLEATRLIRAGTRNAATPVIAMTANSGIEMQLKCTEAGMDDFMTKPFAPDALFAQLSRWLLHTSVVPAATSGLAVMKVSTGDPAVIDLSILARSVDGDADKVRRYAGMFVDAIPETLAALDAALGRGDLKQLADLGHRLKASSKVVGALGFAEMCQELEDARHGGTLEQVSDVVCRMPGLLAQVAAEIEKELA